MPRTFKMPLVETILDLKLFQEEVCRDGHIICDNNNNMAAKCTAMKKVVRRAH